MATPQGRHLGTTHPSKSRTQNLCILDLRLRRALPSRRAHRRRRTAAATITVQAAARGALAPAPSAVNVTTEAGSSYLTAGGGERGGQKARIVTLSPAAASVTGGKAARVAAWLRNGTMKRDDSTLASMSHR